MKLLAATTVWVSLLACAHGQGINAGHNQAEPTKPFVAREVASFDTPWAIAFLPDGRMLVTEKPGRIFLVTQSGRKTPVGNVPAVAAVSQNGLLDIAVSPHFQSDRGIYFSFSEPGPGGSSLALARATLAVSETAATLEDRQVIWRQSPKGGGGQPGGVIAFDPDGSHLFLTSGDRMRPLTAQDPDQALGKVLRLNPDGSTPADNPHADEGGVRAQTWTMGHRNPYGLAFAPDGKLWLHEMGPRGGDELNLIEPGGNYGWPLVSNGDNYDGTPIPRHSTRPEFVPPVLYWNPVIAPAGLAFYDGRMFPQWRGSALIGGLASMALVRVTFDGRGGAAEADRWDMGARIRDVAVAPDGALWVIEDDDPGRLLRLTPGKS
ncbi:PQQ-dependent sugar dehydrogenase [Labrys wisconsinensis]|uniref:Glucose/arabinose dehydrogenase n=1 Tax=Labrys wisconsinensis TaxID=425677 RepID=A0ABU0J703_9HYPH|nr:PQQ-dependent sugar dehydrogenase [Labrys wisconsinensis]MDQ0470047.1 glucose/arabinose dehydrogenase [Labrys wisconsinensis]